MLFYILVEPPKNKIFLAAFLFNLMVYLNTYFAQRKLRGTGGRSATKLNKKVILMTGSAVLYARRAARE